MATATDTTPIDPAPPPNPDPYVIYQLRKPSQRGTAVIPRYIPNTHAPPYSATNYRFARVWHTPDTSALIHAPRSFEYAGSLGSESSFWSDTSSWVSVSSLRTAPSDRQPLLHSTPVPVSAASFFHSELETPQLRTPSSKRTSQLSSPLRDEYRFPAALSESISEDAIIDDLLHRRPEPLPQRYSSRDHPNPVRNATSQQTPRSVPYTSSRMPQKSAWPLPSLLPSLTRKRRNLWQWLFCSEPAAASTTVHSVSNTPYQNQLPSPVIRAKSSQTPRDRVPGGDKDFLRRANDAPDAKTKRGRRAPSFEILRGRPEGSARRSISWSLMPAFLNRDTKKSPAKDNRKGKTKGRAVPAEDEGRANRSIFHSAAMKMGILSSRREPDASLKKTDSRRNQDKARERPREERSREDRSREERSRERLREDRPRDHQQSGREDRPRGDRPRAQQSPRRDAPVPNLHKETRVRSTESGEQNSSRITSDLTNTTGERTRSGRSTPRVRISDATDFSNNPALSDVSSHASGPRASPHSEESAVSPTLQKSVEASPVRGEIFGYPSSSESGAFVEPRQKRSSSKAYPEHRESRRKESPGETRDPVARAKEKNRLRSTGGPLSYLTKQHEVEHDVDTQSTGLTSLADESVSTHKSISTIGDETRAHRFPLKGAEEEGRRPIFKDAVMFTQMGRVSPSRASSGSPGRLHSDWSDPHATDIDVYCQCSCSCVYEEECRRNCESVYGRSPSSSTTSGKREFRVLPPAMSATGKQKMGSPPHGDLSTGLAGMSPLAKSPLEVSVEKRVMRASAMDELPDIRRAEGGAMAGTNVLNPRGVGLKENAGRDSIRAEAQAREARRRSAPEGYPQKTVTISTDDLLNTGRNVGTGRDFRSSGGYYNGTRREEGKPPLRREDGKPPLRREEGKSSSRRRSGYDTTRENSRRQAQGRLKDPERRQREDLTKKPSDGSHQMGNNHVVKRTGPPPLNKTSIPAPYRASGYGREVSYEYEDGELDAGVGYNEGELGLGAPPVVELEFETRGASKYEAQKRVRPESTGRNATKDSPRRVEGSPPGQKVEGGYQQQTGTRGSSKEVRVNSRQTSKNSSRSRTPILGIF